MKVEENVILAKLFDAYGELLSEGQRMAMKCYLNDDLTVSEIAENLEVSRQAVMDSITKAEKKLYSYEEKLGLAKRLGELEREIERLKSSRKED